MLFVRPSLILVFDRLSDEMFCIAPLWPDTSTPAQVVEAASERIDDALRRLAAPVPMSPIRADLPEPKTSPVMPAEDYKAMVLKATDYLEAGDIFQDRKSVVKGKSVSVLVDLVGRRHNIKKKNNT